MDESLTGPAMVLALVLAEVAVGGTALLWATPAWGRARPGFYKLVGAVLLAAAALAWLAARGPLGGEGAPGARGAAVVLLAATAGASLLWQVLLWLRARNAARALGIATVPVGVAALVALAAVPAARNATAVAAFQLLAGAVFAGAITDGLLLGHWYLVDRKLSPEPLARINRFLLAGCALAAVAAIVAGPGGRASAQLSPLLGVGALTFVLALGLIAVCALIGFFIRGLVRENSLQAATGFFYLAVIMGIAAEFAAKVDFY